MSPGLLATGISWEGFTQTMKDDIIKTAKDASKEEELLELLVDITEYCLDDSDMEKWVVQIKGPMISILGGK